jgi:flagellar hook-basal body complex protein FliE
MDLKLKPFDFAQAVARAGLRTDGTPLAGGVGGAGAAQRTDQAAAAGAASFQNAMSSALKQVSEAQNEASTLQKEFQLGNSSVSL